MQFKPARSTAVLLCALLVVCIIVFPLGCAGYSVLTHEEIIDLLWNQQIKPLLLARGEYPLADATYRELLDDLAYDKFSHVDQSLRDNILNFYGGFGPLPPGTRLDRCSVERWRKTWGEVNQLRALAILDPLDQAPSTAPAPTFTLASDASQPACGQ